MWIIGKIGTERSGRVEAWNRAEPIQGPFHLRTVEKAVFQYGTEEVSEPGGLVIALSRTQRSSM